MTARCTVMLLRTCTPRCCRCQFDSTLFVVDRDDVLQLYRHQPSANDFEGNPVHRKPPLKHGHWMYSAAVTPP